MGIDNSKIRKAANGGMLIEIPGPERHSKADVLAAKLNSVLIDAKIKRSLLLANVRLTGLDDSISIEEVKCTLSEIGNCTPNNIRVNAIRPMTNGFGITWAQLPVEAALRATKESRIWIGWTSTRIELLAQKRIQCFKCWNFGHARYTCKNSIDRTNLCFKSDVRATKQTLAISHFAVY